MASTVFRWVHVLGGAAWFGTVVLIAFVLVPTLVRADPEKRAWMLRAVFPRIFRLASVLVATALLGGAGLYLSLHDWRPDLGFLVSGRAGISILVGGGLGLALGLFHFLAEQKLESAAHRSGDDPEADERLVRRLRIIPRVGVGILLVVFGSMMYAARGF